MTENTARKVAEQKNRKWIALGAIALGTFMSSVNAGASTSPRAAFSASVSTRCNGRKFSTKIFATA
jgi:hypothetical protein